LAFFGSISGKNIGMFAQQAVWVVVGVAAVFDFLAANFAREILNFSWLFSSIPRCERISPSR
jgi:hypothetical protein